eukprot:gene17760-biopygen9896
MPNTKISRDTLLEYRQAAAVGSHPETVANHIKARGGGGTVPAKCTEAASTQVHMQCSKFPGNTGRHGSKEAGAGSARVLSAGKKLRRGSGKNQNVLERLVERRVREPRLAPNAALPQPGPNGSREGLEPWSLAGAAGPPRIPGIPGGAVSPALVSHRSWRAGPVPAPLWKDRSPIFPK